MGRRSCGQTDLMNDYLVDERKVDLLLELYAYRQQTLGKPEPNTAGVYIGIILPTRCLYCSSTSNQVGPEEIDRYLNALYKEISFVGRVWQMTASGPESIYIGGGTPTTLTRRSS